MFRDRIQNDHDTGFDLLWVGPNATNVPKEAILVDSLSQDIQLSNSSQWQNSDDVRYYGRNSWQTNLHGASLTYTFEGVAIWFYGTFIFDLVYYNVSLDGGDPEQLKGVHPNFITQQMLWSKTGLAPGRHTFTLTHNDANGKLLSLNYFRYVVPNSLTLDESKFYYPSLCIRVLRNEDASALPSSAFTTAGSSTISSVNPPTTTAPISAPTSSPSNSSTIFLAVGLSIGILFLVVVTLFAFLYIRRSRRKRRTLDLGAPPPTSHLVVPSTTWPVVRKQPLWAPSQPGTSEVSSSGLDIPSSVEPTSTGLPPSYESHFQNERVVLPQER